MSLQISGRAKQEIQLVSKFIADQQLTGIFLPDHLCYKCASHEDFISFRATCESESIYLYESWIGSRLIAIAKLREPIETSFGSIGYLEIQDKKEGSGSLSGFTHIEFYPSNGDYDVALATLVSRGLNIVADPTPHHPIHEIALSDSFVFRLEHEPVIEKVKREEL